MLFYLRIAAVLLPAAIRGSSLEPALPEEAGARLRAAIERAVTSNPEIAAMEARISAARHRVSQATALPDPEIEIGLKDVPVSDPSLTRDPMTMEMIMARQRLPGAGKLGVEERAAKAEFEGMEADHARHIAEVAANVADSFFRLAALDRKTAIARETLQRLADAVAAARERYRVGKSAQADVLRAHLDRTALEDRLAMLSGDRRSEAARFNSLQDLPAGTEVPAIDAGGDFEAGITAGPVPAAADLIRLAEQESPAVAVASAEVRREEARLESARLERRPDWMLQTYYGRRESFEDMAGVSVSFNLPWVHPRRLEAKKAEREAELSGSKATLAAVRNALRRDIEQAWSDLGRNREQARLYRESILPQAEINYRAAREAYAVGTVDFLTYVRAATDLAMYESESVERETGAARALAALQKASGLPLIAGTPAAGGIHAETK